MKLQQLLDGYLKQEQDRKRQRSGKFSPSMFGRCYRAQIWNRKDEPITNPVDERTLRIFKTGKLFHDFIQQFIPDQEKEVLCETDDVKGYADIVTKDTVYDLKSQHSRAFHYMRKESYDIATERYANWLQVAFYASHLKKDRVGLACVSRDDLCIQEYYMPTERWIQPLLKELTILRGCWEKDLPEGEPRAYNKKECNYCLFYDRCKSPKKTKRKNVK